MSRSHECYDCGGRTEAYDDAYCTECWEQRRRERASAMREDVLPAAPPLPLPELPHDVRERAVRAEAAYQRFASAPVADLPTHDAAHVRCSMVDFFVYPFKNKTERLDAADRIIRRAVELGVSTRAFLITLMETTHG